MLKYVENVEEMKHQPWAGLAWKCLKEGISKFKNSMKEPITKGITILGGPMMILQVSD